ncbi:hypothetical protein F5B22DRAFT_17987 [Xylaria bambusicola]|uniref:uncharacterized protein n=1 Tax=Xylaria bambusicola TaxID=326684 RepID=UPI002008E402|nr:uncharacterized protein F5B22DRAFT_17987 [Xylaria bambusicola]KAI0528069.1 hypothetical protein F5B22DRAFT_17987 [Xylaria bambusicola]
MASDRTYWDPDDSDDEINISMIPKAPTPIHPPSKESSDARCPVLTDSPRLAPLPGPPVGESTEASNISPLRTLPATSDTINPICLAFGDMSEKGTTFIPWKLVRGYPRMYIGMKKKNQQRIIEVFKEALLEDRDWDVFAQCDPTISKMRNLPLVLVPTIQFEQFLSSINNRIDEELSIPKGRAGELFFLTFGEWDTPRPRFLGRANNASSIDRLETRSLTLPANDLSHLTHACYQMYQEKMDEIYSSLTNAKNQKKRERAMKKRRERNKASGRMLKRVQRYLGLRQATSHVSLNKPLRSWSTSQPAPFKARESVRFVCVDIEAYEKDDRTITEVGLAVLDTEDLIDIPPGEKGENWCSLIQPYHLRIQEHRYLVNSEYLQGCPDAFNFGESQFVPLKETHKVVGKIIGDKESGDQRPVIIVGHEVQADLKFLLKIGYNPWSEPLIVDEVDTRDLFQRIKRSTDVRGLETMCTELGIFGKNYHNGGNDAVYTLQAMIAMAIKRTVEGSGRKEVSSTPGTDEWSDGEMDDGGCAKRSMAPVETTRASHSEDGSLDVQW